MTVTLARLSLCLLLMIASANISHAKQPVKAVQDWWPDPSSGLMWTGEAVPEGRQSVNFNQAAQYCSTLQLAGFSDWRLPTLDEVKGVLVTVDVPAQIAPVQKLRGGFREVAEPAYSQFALRAPLVPSQRAVWTSTAVDRSHYWVVILGNDWRTDLKFEPKRGGSAFCVRPMEPEILSAAKQAQTTHAVTDLQTLKDCIPLEQAFSLYKQGNYQQSLAQAQATLALKPGLAFAQFDIGLCYAALKEWDQALAAFKAALQLDKQNTDTQLAINWARQSQKAESGEGKVKLQAPDWQ